MPHWNLSLAHVFYETLAGTTSKDGGGRKMAVSEVVAAYRLRSAQCIEIAQRSQDLETKLALLAMAQTWLTLADRAIKNSETVLARETPTRS